MSTSCQYLARLVGPVVAGGRESRRGFVRTTGDKDHITYPGDVNLIDYWLYVAVAGTRIDHQINALLGAILSGQADCLGKILGVDFSPLKVHVAISHDGDNNRILPKCSPKAFGIPSHCGIERGPSLRMTAEKQRNPQDEEDSCEDRHVQSAVGLPTPLRFQFAHCCCWRPHLLHPISPLMRMPHPRALNY